MQSRKSKDTWSNRHFWPWSTKWSRAKANRVLTTNTLFQQHKRRLYIWTSPDGKYWNQTDYILAAKDGEALYSQQKQDWELTVAQIMISLLQEVIPGETRWKGYRIFLYYFLQMQVYNYGK